MGNSEDRIRAAVAGETERDAVLTALAHPYRRFVLQYLDQPGDDATIGEVAAALAPATPVGATEPAGCHQGVDAIQTSLYHVHVPKLADVGVVAFDPREGRVTLTERWHEICPILRAIEDL